MRAVVEMLCTVPDAAGADVKTPPAVYGARNAVTAGREAASLAMAGLDLVLAITAPR